MKKSKSKCYNVVSFDQNLKPIQSVYLTYRSDMGQGYTFLSCLECGTIYLYDSEHEVYVGPSLEEKLTKTNCCKCNSQLSKSAKAYPEEFLGEDKKIHKFYNPYLVTMPPEEDLVVEEFWDLYSDDKDQKEEPSLISEIVNKVFKKPKDNPPQ